MTVSSSCAYSRWHEAMRLSCCSQEKSLSSSIHFCLLTKLVLFSFLPTDKHETKLKGVIYFQAIEEVYYDHLRSATKVRRNTRFLSSLFTHSLFSSHILFHFQHVCAHTALLLLSVLLLWPAAVTEGIFQLEYDDQCMYLHSCVPRLSSLSPVCPNHRPCSVIDSRRRSPAEWLLLHASHASLILCSLIYNPIILLHPSAHPTVPSWKQSSG